jgi:O-antigen/teichoic acid export membrane protein
MTLTGTKSPGVTIRLLGRLSRNQVRIAAVGDQVIVALTNFALTLALGRAYPAEDFAAYGIGLSIGLMLQGIQRHSVTIPLMLQPATTVRQEIATVLGEQVLTVALAASLGAIAYAIASLVGHERYGLMIVASSGVMLFVYLQLEFARVFLVKIGKPWLLLASAGWYCAVAATLSAAALWFGLPYPTLLAVLAGAMLVHLAVLPALTAMPALRTGWLRLRADLARYGGWSAAATFTYTGYNHVPLFMLGALAAPASAAAFVAARSLMQPLQILLRGFDIADKSRFAELGQSPAGATQRSMTIRLIAIYAVIGLVFAALVALAAEPLMTLAYGNKFSGHGAALAAWAITYVLISIALPLESLVYAREQFARYYAMRGIASLIAIAAAYPLILRFDEVGAIAACGIGWLLAVAGTAALILRRERP